MAGNGAGRCRTTRLLAGLGAATGMLLLARPRQVAERLVPEFPRDRLWLVRLLGARMLAQHAAVLAVPEPQVVRVGAVVDLVHAASMVPLLLAARYRRAAVISGAVAAGYAVLAPAAAPRSQRREASQRG